MPLLPASGGAQSLPCDYSEGSSTVEVHDLCVCSTLYNTMPNMPATSGEYHNEHKQAMVVDEHPWVIKPLNG